MLKSSELVDRLSIGVKIICNISYTFCSITFFS